MPFPLFASRRAKQPPLAPVVRDGIISLLIEKGGAARGRAHELHEPLQAVSTVTPEALPFYALYMSTGSRLAQTSMASNFHSLLHGVFVNKDRSPDPWSTYEDVYRDLIKNYSDMPVPARLHLEWNFSNVADTLGMSRFDVDRVIKYATVDCGALPDEEHTDEYWRGVSAMYLATNNVTAVHIYDHPEFVEWAGSSNDVARIIILAKDRDTFDVDQLQSVMTQQDSITPSMRDGVL